MANKPKLLIFEGPDRAGKTTTMQLVWKARDKIDCCQDRGILSNMVYNAIFKRPIADYDYLDLIPQNGDVHVFYLDCPISVLKQRAIDSKEDEYTIDELCEHKILFKEKLAYLKSNCCNTRITELDTSKHTQAKIVEQILKVISSCK